MNENCSFYNPVYFDPNHKLNGFVFGSSTCIFNTSATTSASYVSGFSYGDIVISFFSFLIFIILAYQFIFNWTRGIKIGKKGI